MPLGAAHTASVEDKMRSEPSKGSGENFYSTGFGDFHADSQRRAAGCFQFLVCMIERYRNDEDKENGDETNI
jgi:hypothetical protein